MQSRIAQALSDAVADRGTRVVGNLVGADKSTVSRWGSDLRSWPADALLAVAHADDAVRAVLVEAFSGTPLPPRTTDAVRDVHATIAALGAEVSLLAGDVADGDVSAREAANGRPKIRELMSLLRKLDADYAAIEKGARQIGGRS